MPDVVSDIVVFRKATGLPCETSPTLLSETRAQLQQELLLEEFQEYVDAVLAEDIEAIADALGDLIVVAVGSMCEHGIPVNKTMRAISRSNMSKLGEDGKPIYRGDGKLLKGPNFVEPDLSFLKGVDPA